MSWLKVLPTVRPRSLWIACAIINAATELGLGDMLITSGNDSTHMLGSKHYSDNALDFRTHDLSDHDKTALVAAVGHRLGPDYQVFIEDVHGANEHAHAEFDPVGGVVTLDTKAPT